MQRDINRCNKAIAKKGNKEKPVRNVVNSCFRGGVHVMTEKISDKKASVSAAADNAGLQETDSKFLFLSIELPPVPLFKDSRHCGRRGVCHSTRPERWTVAQTWPWAKMATSQMMAASATVGVARAAVWWLRRRTSGLKQVPPLVQMPWRSSLRSGRIGLSMLQHLRRGSGRARRR